MAKEEKPDNVGEVTVDLRDFMVTLEKIAKGNRKLKAEGIIPAFHYIKYEGLVNYVKAAKDALKVLEGLPEEHPFRKEIDVTLVREGYELLERGQVGVLYTNPNLK